MAKHYPFLDLGKVNAPSAAALKDACARVIDSGRYIGGTEVEELEHELAGLVGTRHAVGVASGLDALRLTLMAWIELGRMSPGDEVIVPANTYFASVLAVSTAGLKPVLVDADASTHNIDTSLLEMALTPRTRGIMPVHLYGRPAWDNRIACHRGCGSGYRGVARRRASLWRVGRCRVFQFLSDKKCGCAWRCRCGDYR